MNRVKDVAGMPCGAPGGRSTVEGFYVVVAIDCLESEDSIMIADELDLRSVECGMKQGIVTGFRLTPLGNFTVSKIVQGMCVA